MQNLFTPHHTRQKSESVIPLINVIFLLLIFFMIAGQIRNYEMLDVDPPELAIEERLLERPEVLLIIDSQGQVAWDEQWITLDEITSSLAEIADKEGIDITIKIDQLAPSHLLIRLLEELQQIAIENVDVLVVQRCPSC